MRTPLTRRLIRPSSFDDVATEPHTPGAKLLAGLRRCSPIDDLDPLPRVPNSTASVPALDPLTPRIDARPPPPSFALPGWAEPTVLVDTRRWRRPAPTWLRALLWACLFTAAACAATAIYW